MPELFLELPLIVIELEDERVLAHLEAHAGLFVRLSKRSKRHLLLVWRHWVPFRVNRVIVRDRDLSRVTGTGTRLDDQIDGILVLLVFRDCPPSLLREFLSA